MGVARTRVPTAVAALLAALLIPAGASAIDGWPMGVELTNAGSGTRGWVRVADDDALEDGLVSYVLSNDECLPFVSDMEVGDLTDWTRVEP